MSLDTRHSRRYNVYYFHCPSLLFVDLLKNFLLGLYSAAHDLGIEWVIIKGVSDFADGTKSSTNSWRPFSSAMAASLTFHMLRDTLVFKKWKHYERKYQYNASKILCYGGILV